LGIRLSEEDLAVQDVRELQALQVALRSRRLERGPTGWVTL
jgi:hypothetical protein